MVDREPVLQAVRAARVLGDVAADRADLLARRVGRVVAAVADHRLGHLEVRHPGLDGDPRRLEVDLAAPGSSARARSRRRRRPAARRRRAPSPRRARRTAPPPRGTRARPPAPARSSPAARRATGTTRWPVSPSHSYVRSCSGSSITAPGGQQPLQVAREQPSLSIYSDVRRPPGRRRAPRRARRRDPLRRGARLRRHLQRDFGGRREELLAARAARQQRLLAGEVPDFLGGDAATSARATGRCAEAPPDLAGPPRRDHRPDRPEDGDQRAQLGRAASSWPTSRTRTRRPGRTWSRAS